MATYPFALIVPKGTDKNSIKNEEFFEAINGTLFHKENFEFWCPTPNCEAKLRLCSIKTDIHTTIPPYFRMYTGYKHLDSCQYHKFYKKSHSQKYDIEDFSYTEFTENIIQPKVIKNKKTSSSKSKKKSNSSEKNSLPKIKNIKTIYNFCKFNPSTTPIDNSGITIGDIFIHQYNLKKHNRPINGFKLMELKIKRFDSKENIFYTYCGNQHFSISLPIKAQTPELFNLIKKYIIFPNGIRRAMNEINLVVCAEVVDSKILLFSLNQIMEISS